MSAFTAVSALRHHFHRNEYTIERMHTALRNKGYYGPPPGFAPYKEDILPEVLRAIEDGTLVALEEERTPPALLRATEDPPFEEAPEPVVVRPPPDRYLRVRLIADDQPRARKAYVLKLDDGSQRKGTTAADGVLVEKLPSSVRQVRICIESLELGAEEHVVNLDGLARATSIGGVQQRLRNAGFLRTSTAQMDDETRGALT